MKAFNSLQQKLLLRPISRLEDMDQAKGSYTARPQVEDYCTPKSQAGGSCSTPSQVEGHAQSGVEGAWCHKS